MIEVILIIDRLCMTDIEINSQFLRRVIIFSKYYNESYRRGYETLPLLFFSLFQSYNFFALKGLVARFFSV